MIQRTKSSQSGKATKPAKPRPDFPLFPHASGKWAKSIKGRMYYFGRWSDWQGALDEYIEVRDDLFAGRPANRNEGGLTLRQLCNLFIKSKRIGLDSGRLSPRTFVDYDRVCRLLLDEFGPTRAVTELRPTDFERLYAKLSGKHGVVTLGGEITRCRSVFKYASDSDLVDWPVKFGPLFKTPSKRDRRLARAKAKHQNGSRMLDASEIRALLAAAGPQLRAMILLAINGGLGNTDCASLPISALDLNAGWLDYPRAKTGIERRIPLWPETVQALREVIEKRREPHDEADADLVFITKYGQRWVRFQVVEMKKFGKTEIRGKQDDAITKETTKLLKELDIKRHRVGFYALRHSFETVAGGSKDQVAVDALMGHIDSSMAGEYREGIDDSRLEAVSDFVRNWLFGKERGQGNG